MYCGAIKGRQCPKCKAVVPVGAEVCLFCNASIPRSTPNYVLEGAYAAETPLPPVPPPEPDLAPVRPREPRSRVSRAVLASALVAIIAVAVYILIVRLPFGSRRGAPSKPVVAARRPGRASQTPSKPNDKSVALRTTAPITEPKHIRTVPVPAKPGNVQRQPASAPQTYVRCVLVVPKGEQPWPDAQQRLDMVLKDIQWWYSCQMEGHGYGAKTFPLELGRNGQVRIHLVRLSERQPEGDDKRIQFKVQQACLSAARKVMGNAPKGAIMLVIYNGYIWRNQKAHSVWPCGTGKGRRWVFLTAYHYYCICPAAWHVGTPLAGYGNPDSYFPDEHVEIMRGHYTYRRSSAVQKRWLRRPVGLHAVMGHGTLAHELGHAFGLQHYKKGEPLVHKSVMQNGYVHMRGNFLAERGHESCCLTALDAAKLNKNPFFAERNVERPSTGVEREVGMRGAKQAIEAAAAFAAKHRANRDRRTPRLNAESANEPADLARRIVGVWAAGANTSNTITFHTDGTVTASYDNDKSRRWRQEGDRVVFTKGKGQQKVLFFADHKAMRMGNNVWLRVPLPSK